MSKFTKSVASLCSAGWALPVLGLLLAMGLPSDALAVYSPFPVPAGDKSISSFLSPIFGGDLFGSSGGSSPLIAMLGIFNAAALTIGGLLAAYTLVAGTMQTAHDGEMLGKRWSSMWLPIRTTLGVGLVVPISGGYCVAQLLVGWLCMQGVGLADTLWSSFAGSAFTSTGGLAPRAAPPNVNELAQSMLMNQVCLEAGKAIAASGSSATSVTDTGWAATPYSGVDPSTNLTFNGKRYGSAQNPSSCGSLSYPKYTTSVTAGLSYGAITMTDAERASAATTINSAMESATIALETAVHTLAVDIVNNPTGTHDVSSLGTAASAYTTTIGIAANSAISSANAMAAIKASATSDGWVMAGAWFMRIAAMQDAINSVASQTPTTSAPSSSLLKNDDFKVYLTAMQAAVANNPSTNGYQKMAVNVGSHVVDNESSGWGAGKVKEFIRDISSATAIKFRLDPARHPILAAKDFGDSIMGTVEFAIIAIGAGILLLGVASTAGAGFVSLIASAILLPLFAFGAGLSLYIPMIPFITFFGCALAWVLLVCEAVIAAPLWAVMHLSPSGDDIMGGAKQGYMILLGLLLRPALLIFGFCFCVVAIEPLLQFYNQIFFPVFFASQANSLTGLVSMVIGVAIYFATLSYFVHKIFGVIHLIPDQLLGWIGGGHGQLGSIGGGAADSAQRGHAGILNATSQISSGLGNQVQNALNNKANQTAKQSASDRSAINDTRGEASKGSASVAGELNAAGAADAKHSEAVGTGKASDHSSSAMSNASSAGAMASKMGAWMEKAANVESQMGSRQAAFDGKSGSYKSSSDGQQESKELGKLAEEAQELNSNIASVGGKQEQAIDNAASSLGELSAQSSAATEKASGPGASKSDKQNASRLNNLLGHTVGKINEGDSAVAAGIFQKASANNPGAKFDQASMTQNSQASRALLDSHNEEPAGAGNSVKTDVSPPESKNNPGQ